MWGLGGQDVGFHFLELDQRAVEVPGIEKEDRQTVGAELRRAIAEHAGAPDGEGARGVGEVGHLEADVVHAAGGALGEEFCNGGVGAEWGHQLELGILELDEDNGDAVLGQWMGLTDGGAEEVAVPCCGGREIGNRDGDVIEAADQCRRPPARYADWSSS